jgi:predicted nuclease of predicted toxin-antitoxin system
VIFIDCSLPRSLADRLKEERDDIIWLGDLFDLDTPDETWLAEAGSKGWLVITHDKRIRKRPDERRVLLESGVGCFILVYKQNLKREEIYELVISVLDKMEENFASTSRPFIYTVDKKGTFREYVVKDR